MFILQKTTFGMLAAGCFLLLTACSPRISRDITNLKGVMLQIQVDKNHAFLGSLQPNLEDCKQIFADEEEAGMAFAYAQQKFASLTKLPDGAMKPPTENSRLVILAATQEQLVQGDLLPGFTPEYQSFAKKLRPGTRLFSIRYEDAEGKEEKTRASFFKLKDKWVFIPRPFMAFIREEKFD